MKKKLAVINYINSYPFLDGMDMHEEFNRNFEILKAVPAACAVLFKQKKVDVAIVPVGALPTIPSYTLLSDYCIAADKHVKTVAVFANQPIDQLKCIYLDADSRSSVWLLKILLAEYWMQAPALKDMSAFDGILKEEEGLLCIGDKTFPMLGNFQFEYDLAKAWNALTGLPFVFAVWIGHETLNQMQIELLNDALKLGVENRSQLANTLMKENPTIDFNDYYFNCINYKLDSEKLKAINLFLEKIKNYD